MHSIRAFAFSALIALALAGCGTEGSGVPAEEVRELPPFTALVNETSVGVEIEAGPGLEPSVRIQCDDNLLPFIRTRVSGEELVLDLEPGTWLMPRTPCLVHVTHGALEEVVTAGSGDIEVWGESSALTSARVAGSGSISIDAALSAPELELLIEGSGDLVADRFEGEHLLARVGGSGSIRVDDGRSTTATALIDGSGGIDLDGVEVAEASATVAGSGSVVLRVTERVEAHIDGSGDIIVHGDPAERDELDEGSGGIVYR